MFGLKGEAVNSALIHLPGVLSSPALSMIIDLVVITSFWLSSIVTRTLQGDYSRILSYIIWSDG